jgi:hypothetical protein
MGVVMGGRNGLKSLEKVRKGILKDKKTRENDGIIGKFVG